MELRLQKFISSMGTLSDVRNLDPYNPIVVLLEHPVTAIQYTIIVSIVEPSYMGIPINCIWVCMDSTKPSYKKALKLKAINPADYEGDDPLVDGFKQAWITLSKYDNIFSDPQYYDNGSGGGVAGPQGPKGDKGDKGDTGPMGPAGPKGDTPTLDMNAIAAAVAAILGGAPANTLSITGAATIVEGGNSTYAVNLVSGSNTTPIVVQISASTGSSAVTIDANNKVTAKAVSADTDVVLNASYVDNGTTLTATKTIKVLNAALSSISATGLAATLFEGKTAQLAVTAAYSNGTNAAVTANATYAVAPPAAGSVNASGLFTAALVAADTPFAITVTYVEGGVTKTATLNSTNQNIIPTSLAINGSATVDENTAQQYTATVTRNDGTAATVTPTWTTSPSSSGTLDASGLFTGADVSADVTANLSASYVESGVTVTAQKTITIKNVVAAITPFFGVASTSAAKDANLILSLTGRGPSASRLMNPCTMNAGVGQSYYYAYPVSYGTATFIDLSNGFEGGMDGAHGDRGATLGPIVVNVTIGGQSIPFYLYASDQSNLGTTNWNVM